MREIYLYILQHASVCIRPVVSVLRWEVVSANRATAPPPLKF